MQREFFKPLCKSTEGKFYKLKKQLFLLLNMVEVLSWW